MALQAKASNHPEQSGLKVFISYSRKDEDFARDLCAGLEAADMAPFLDRHDIAPGEDWEARLGRLIESADVVVFVLSPDSIASERCAWEVAQTSRLNKRLLPIVWRSVAEAQVPPGVKQLNYIFFNSLHIFGAPLFTLVQALRTDLDWTREHTRIGEAALRWRSRGQPESLLLRGDELASAAVWLKGQPQFAPEPSLLTLDFLKASEDAEAARSSAESRRLERERAALRMGQRALATAAALFACIVLGAVGVYNKDYLFEQYHWRTAMGPDVLSARVERENAALPLSDFRECRTGCPDMVVVPGGGFEIGSPKTEQGHRENEEPQRRIDIAKPFAMGRTEVTFGQWKQCVRAGACREVQPVGEGDERPVANVDWNDAVRYVEWLSRITGRPYRLPSEAEWEYAARAGTIEAYALETGQPLGDVAWHSRTAIELSAPVGTKKPNRFKLYDMHGNVSEWVADCWADNYASLPADGMPVQKSRCSNRVTRGGSWNDISIEYLRSARRNLYSPGTVFDDLGFRVARTLN